MNTFFEEFQSELKLAVEGDFKELIQMAGNEKPYACALVTDSYAMTVYFAFNTEEQLRKIVTEKGPEHEPYYRWTPAEWKYGDHITDDKVVRRVNDRLTRQRMELKPEAFQQFEIGLYETMTAVLKALIEEGLFSGLTVFISISDDNRARAVENYSAGLLNPPAVAEAFLKRFDDFTVPRKYRDGGKQL